MKGYDQIIESLSKLPRALVAAHDDVLFLIRQHSLMGSGIGYVDAHLLASAQQIDGVRLLTRDKRLARVAAALGVGYTD